LNSIKKWDRDDDDDREVLCNHQVKQLPVELKGY